MTLSEQNPDRHYLRGRLRTIALLYAGAAAAALGLGFGLSGMHSGLTGYEVTKEPPAELVDILDRAARSNPNDVAAVEAAVDRWPAECFAYYVDAEMVRAAKQGSKVTLLAEWMEEAMARRLDPARVEAEMRRALVLGRLDQRRKVLDVLELHPGEATQRLLRLAAKDLDPGLAARARAAMTVRHEGK